jgi:hypothetical protein
MASLILNLTSSENKFRYEFTNEFYEKDYEIAVTKIHGIARIQYTFDYIKYDKKNDEITPESFEIEIDNTFTDFEDIVKQINDDLPHGSKNVFEFELNENNQVEISIKQPNFEIDFTSKNSIGKIFGFEEEILKQKENIAKKEFKIPNKTLFITTDIIGNTYFNNQERDILFTFTTKDDGYVYLSNVPIYLKTFNKLKNLIISIVDIDNNKIDFDECDLLVHLHLKPITS